MSDLDVRMIPQWNAKAIDALRMGDFELAVSTLKMAMAIMLSANEQENELMVDDDATSDHHPASEQQDFIRSVCISEKANDAQYLSDTMDNALFDFFPKAFEYVSSTHIPIKSGYKQSVVILYNMALAIDTLARGSIDSTMAVDGLQKFAMNLYVSARDLILFHWLGSSAKDVPGMSALLLAIANNLGRLNSLHLSCQDTRTSLMLMLDLFQDPETIEQVDSDDFDRLSLSVVSFMYLQRDTILIAASAA